MATPRFHVPRARLFSPAIAAFFAAVTGSLALASSAHADDDDPIGRVAYRRYGAESGLAVASTFGSVQDDDGFVWVGADGLYRYEGDRFRYFGIEAGLPSTTIWAMAIAGDGRIAAATDSGVVRFDGVRFVAVPADAGLPKGPAYALAREPEGGRLWTATVAGVFRETAGGRWEAVAPWTDGSVRALRVDADGSAWGVRGRTVEHRFADGRIETVGTADGAPALPGSAVTVLQRDGQGRLWLRSSDHLWMREAAGGPFLDKSGLAGAASIGDDLTADRHGGLWLDAGRQVLHIAGDRATLLGVERGYPPLVRGVLEDRGGTLWFAGDGLSRLRGNGRWTRHTTLDGLPDDLIWSLGRDAAGHLFAGTGSGLVVGTRDGFRVVGGSESHGIRAVARAPDGTTWMGGSPFEVLRRDAVTGKVDAFGAAAGLEGSRVLTLVLDRNGELWVGTEGGGLFSGTPRGDGITFTRAPLVDATGDAGRDAVERVAQVVEDAQGRIWATGTRGLSVRESLSVRDRGDRGDRDRWRRFTVADGLKRNAVSYLVARRDGSMCVSYLDSLGASCFVYEGGRLEKMEHIDGNRGLVHGRVYFLGEDARGGLWIGTGKGVDLFGPKGHDHFDETDGLPGNDCDATAFLADPNGDVWVGTSTGIGHFEAAGYDGPIAPPTVAFVDVRLGDAWVERSAIGAVPSQHATLAARFTAIAFANEDRVEHEVRLVGLETEWHASEGRQARYSALAPGHYELEVRARVAPGTWGAPSRFVFDVIPAWWQTLVAKITAVTLAAFALAMFVRWRLRRLRGLNVELERLVDARTQELSRAQAKVAESEKLSALGRVLAQLSHELNNPVNVIANNVEPMRGYLADLIRAVTELREAAEATSEGRARAEALFEKLELEYVTQDFGEALNVVALASARVRTVHSELRAFMRGGEPEKLVGDPTPGLRETVAMVRRGLPAEVTLREVYEDLPPVAFHRGQLDQVFLNLLQNALHAVGERGEIVVTASFTDTTIEVTFDDSGPGVDEAIRERIFEPFFTTKDVGKGTGLGLSICRRIIVETHGGTLDVERSPSGGARFVVRIPRIVR